VSSSRIRNTSPYLSSHGFTWKFRLFHCSGCAPSFVDSLSSRERIIRTSPCIAFTHPSLQRYQQPTMPTTFHPFPDLTAELRSSIWKFALQNDKAHRIAQAGRAIQVFNYDPSGGTITVAISIPYPLLFTVSREARYEAAKLDGCKWMTVHARYRGREGTSNIPRSASV
jgi:hypothetical protein